MTKPAKKRTRLSPEARKNQLLDVSKAIILSDGLQGFSMEALARTAEVSSPLVYKYFDSRVDALRQLLAREYRSFVSRLDDAVASADSFEEVVRLNIESNFDHYAPGNIIPILESQPEIAVSIENDVEKNGRNLARYLVRETANTFNLSQRSARLLVRMSSGASIAAAEHAAIGAIDREQAIDAALAYIMAGVEQAANT